MALYLLTKFHVHKCFWTASHVPRAGWRSIIQVETCASSPLLKWKPCFCKVLPRFFKCLLLKKQAAFLGEFKAILYKWQLVVSHKLYITAVSVISLKCFVDWLIGLCVIVLQWSNTLLFPFYSHHLDTYLPGGEPQTPPTRGTRKQCHMLPSKGILFSWREFHLIFSM